MLHPLLLSSLLLSGAVLSAAQVTIRDLNGTKDCYDFLQKNDLVFVLFHNPDVYYGVDNTFEVSVEQLAKVSTVNDVKFASVNYRNPNNIELFNEFFGDSKNDPRILFFKNYTRPDPEQIYTTGGVRWESWYVARWMYKMIIDIKFYPEEKHTVWRKIKDMF